MMIPPSITWPVNLFLSRYLPGLSRLRFSGKTRRRRDAFALVVTLLILSLLIIVAVSFLTSMSAEHQTADAYAASASAEQAARAGLDSATAILTESFRDFPDSATVWDNQQSINFGSSSNAAIVNGTYNEGTSLYLRGVPSAADSTAYAVALPSGPNGPTYTNSGTSYASNDPKGNDPNDPACQNFVLPLISGLPSGHARLPSARSAYYASHPSPTTYDTTFPPPMNLSEPDPAKQTWVDLNVRRFGKTSAYPNGDLQGAIGSPPGWAGLGPKPARAYWVNVKGNDGLINSRYAFWIDDESFRANNNLSSDAQTPYDNLSATGTSRPLDTSNPPKPRLELPGDLTLFGPLSAAVKVDSGGITDASGTATAITNTRKQGYPGNFFPDRLAFSHGFDGTIPQGAHSIDEVRYLTTNQSSTLNLSRHGSQRLNLNSTISTTTSAIQTQVDQLVQTLEYHLPYFGQRFYRTNSSALNDTTQVPGSTNSGGYSPPTSNSNSQIYYYKVAANLRDYVDTDDQPTVIGQSGVVMTGPMSGTLDETGANQIWAQGKECTPYIQEVAVRYRPVVTYTTHAASAKYTMSVDYYVEFWNMSDRDISASQMNGPTVWVRDHQSWTTYYTGDTLGADPSAPSNTEALVNNNSPADTQIDLLNGVTDGNGAASANGVVFRAGTVTLITTDPQCASYRYTELLSNGKSGATGGKTNNPAFTNASGGCLPNLANVYVCPVLSGHRLYAGLIYPHNSAASTTSSVGLGMGTPFYNGSPYTGTEVSMVNSQGYFDVVRGAITKTGVRGYSIYTVASNTDTSQGGYADYSYGSSMMGNAQDTGGGPTPGSETPTVSQLGDPRTNNEQLSVNDAATTAADGTRFMASTRTLGSPNYPDLQPDTTATGENWPDYYKFPPANGTVAHPSPDYTTAPAVIAGNLTADGPITSIGQLGDVFDPARAPGSSILYSHGGGRTFKIGQHDDLYSDDPTTNVPSTFNNLQSNTADGVPASSGWASWRLADIFDVADPIQLPGRININGIMRDNGAALLSALQGFTFHPKTGSGTTDPIIHGDGSATPPLTGSSFDTTNLDPSNPTHGFSQLVAQMKLRLDAVTAASSGSRVKPFFERGELGELGAATANPLFGTNSTASNTTLVSGVDMNKTADHSREEIFRRLAEMICTRGNTFTVYAAGQSILQPPGTTATTADTAVKKITGTQRMRVTFRLVPKAKDPTSGVFTEFHPAYTTATDGTINGVNSIDPTNPTKPLTSGKLGVIPRYAKPDRYDVQILEAIAY